MTIPMICAGIFFLIGLAIMASGWMTFHKSNQAAVWPSTTGTIITSEVLRSTGGKLSFSAHIVYQYAAQGGNHVSTRVSIPELMGIVDTGQKEAMAKVEKYPIHSTVTVYYDPQDPQRAVLEKRGDVSLFYLGAVFLVFALVIWFLR
ncbi:MAG: DUF3592 domain-containing protein [Anaerolineales bacterium]|nr:DUF3592 domain-containing protein [Anaerolineales bacterium]